MLSLYFEERNLRLRERNKFQWIRAEMKTKKNSGVLKSIQGLDCDFLRNNILVRNNKLKVIFYDTLQRSLYLKYNFRKDNFCFIRYYMYWTAHWQERTIIFHADRKGVGQELLSWAEQLTFDSFSMKHPWKRVNCFQLMSLVFDIVVHTFEGFSSIHYFFTLTF